MMRNRHQVDEPAAGCPRGNTGIGKEVPQANSLAFAKDPRTMETGYKMIQTEESRLQNVQTKQGRESTWMALSKPWVFSLLLRSKVRCRSCRRFLFSASVSPGTGTSSPRPVSSRSPSSSMFLRVVQRGEVPPFFSQVVLVKTLVVPQSFLLICYLYRELYRDCDTIVAYYWILRGSFVLLRVPLTTDTVVSPISTRGPFAGKPSKCSGSKRAFPYELCLV